MRSTILFPAVLLALSVQLLLPGVGDAQVTRDPTAQAAYEEGMQLLDEEKYEDAIVKFNEATSIDDTFAEAYLGEGDALRELEDFQAALQSYTQARDRNQQLARVHFGLGVCHKETGQFDLAVNDFSNAVDIDRRDPEILTEFGKLYIDIGNPSSAEKYLESAIDIDPNNAETYRDLAWVNFQLGQPEAAIDNFEKSIELDPEDHETHYRLANLHLFKEDYRDAVKSLSETIDNYVKEEPTDPNDFISGYLLRANTLLKLAGEEDTPAEERDELFQKVIDDSTFVIDEYPERDAELGNALFYQGTAMRMLMRFGEATKALTEAIQLASSSGGNYLAEAYLKRGICWLNQGEPKLARRDFEQAAALNYEDPLPSLWIGFTHAYEDDFRKAIESYGEAIAKNPTQTSAFVNRGLAYMQEEGYRKAVDNFNEAIRLEPNESEHFYKRGIAYMWLEDFEKAFNSFELAVLYDEKSAKAYRAGARALRELDRGELAQQYESRASELESQQNGDS